MGKLQIHWRSDPFKEQQTSSEAERALDPKGDVFQQRMSSISGGDQDHMVAVETDPASRSARHNDRCGNSEKPRAKILYHLSNCAPHRAVEGIVMHDVVFPERPGRERARGVVGIALEKYHEVQIDFLPP